MISRTEFVAVAAATLALSLVIGLGATQLPVDKGYTIVGTRVFPLMVAGLLGVVGLGLLWQAMCGHVLRAGAATAEVGRLAVQPKSGLTWVCVGLLLHALLIERLGFVLSATLLYACAARGFGGPGPARLLATGLAVTWPVYLLFTQGLGIGLPELLGSWL
jgi:putative tricarboxylic transport membrane protein